MKKLFLFTVACLLFSSISLGQEEFIPCTVSTGSSTELRGYIMHVDTLQIDTGFNLYRNKNKDQSIKIKPRTSNKVQINRVIYRSMRNRQNKPRFMKELIVGTNASLYLYCYKPNLNYNPNNTEGFSGFAMGVPLNIEEYYMLREDQFQYVRKRQLLEKPESYFPDAMPLCKVIKNTKMKDIVKWVGQYNSMFPRQ